MFETLMQTQRAALTAVVFLLVFFALLAIGRILKRRFGVRLGIFFRLFALAVAFYAAISFYGVETTWRGHVGAAVVLTSTALIIALFDRYVWDYYYETRAAWSSRGCCVSSRRALFVSSHCCSC
jgi:hypothetical protein